MSDLRPGVPKDVLDFFPYSDLRPHQDELMRFVFGSLRAGKSAVAEGSNGLGKTAAVLSAALPIAKNGDYKILYCARTHGQMDRVIEELELIAQKRSVSGISIRGRSEMCVHRLMAQRRVTAREAMEVCKQLRSEDKCPFYVNMRKRYRRREKLQKLIMSKPFTVSEILQRCKKAGFCPYEFLKLIVDHVDVVALSYVYLLDDVVRNSFMSNFTKPLSESILVFDEAHNLPGMALEIASRDLSLYTVRRAEKEARRYGQNEIAHFCRRLVGSIEGEAQQCDEERQIPAGELIERLGVEDPLQFFDDLVYVGKEIARDLFSRDKYPRSYIRSLGDFLLTWMETSDDPNYTHLVSRYETMTGALSARLEILALAPDELIAPVLRSARSTVHVSATLEPIEAYMKTVGLPSGTPHVTLRSPFPSEHILTIACKGVRTDLEHRTPSMYRKLAKRIAEAIRYTPANVGVFAASFDVLEGLIGVGSQEISTKRVFFERRNLSSKENDRMIRAFKSLADKGGAVLFGVVGGRNAEGRDYPGDSMNTSVIVGVPFAKPLPRTRAQEDYFERRFPGHGREYGYVIPALRRAAQTAGRPVRSLEDKGVCIFLDYRFSTAYLRRYLPLWLRRNIRVLPDEDGAIAKELILFFGFSK
ncbi:MAG: helicase C-terminal domain-containing protein [Candidatus Bathyarchaeia archaeon]